MKSTLFLAAQLTSFVSASASVELHTTTAAAPGADSLTNFLENITPNHVAPNSPELAWPRPSTLSALNYTTTCTSSIQTTHTSSLQLASTRTTASTAATDTYPPGPAPFRGTGVSIVGAVHSSSSTGHSSSSSCTSTPTPITSFRTMTTTHIIPAPPPGVLTLPVQSQNEREHHGSGLAGSGAYGTGMAGWAENQAHHWPTQPAGDHGQTHEGEDAYKAGISYTHRAPGTGSVVSKPTLPAGSPLCPQGQACEHPYSVRHEQLPYGSGAVPAKPTQPPGEQGHPYGPPGGKPSEWQNREGEQASQLQGMQHPYQGIGGTGAASWVKPPVPTTTTKAPGTRIYTSTETIVVTVTDVVHPTMAYPPLSDSDLTSIWTPAVWSSQHANATERKNGPTVLVGPPIWTSLATTPSSSHHTTATSHHTTSTLSTVTTKPHPIMNSELALISSLHFWATHRPNAGFAVPSDHLPSGMAAPSGRRVDKTNCTSTFLEQPAFFGCTSTKYQSTTTMFVDCEGCVGRQITTVAWKDKHVCPTHIPQTTLPVTTKTECYTTRSTTVVLRPTGVDGSALPCSTRTATSTHTVTPTHTVTSRASGVIWGTGNKPQPTTLLTVRDVPASIEPIAANPKIVNPTPTVPASISSPAKSTNGLVVAVTGTVSGHYTSYITTLEIVNPATMLPRDADPAAEPKTVGPIDTMKGKTIGPSTTKIMTIGPSTTKTGTIGYTPSTTGLVVAVTGTVSGHYTSYITTLEIVDPATMIPEKAKRAAAPEPTEPSDDNFIPMPKVVGPAPTRTKSSSISKSTSGLVVAVTGSVSGHYTSSITTLEIVDPATMLPREANPAAAPSANADGGSIVTLNPKSKGPAPTNTVPSASATRSTTGLVVAVTGSVDGHYTSYITTLEIVDPATMAPVASTSISKA